MFKRRRINHGADYAVSEDTSVDMTPLLGAMQQLMGFMQELMESNTRIESKIQAIDTQLTKHEHTVAKLTKEIADLQIHALNGSMSGANHEEPAPYMHF